MPDNDARPSDSPSTSTLPTQWNRALPSASSATDAASQNSGLGARPVSCESRGATTPAAVSSSEMSVAALDLRRPTTSSSAPMGICMQNATMS